MSYSYIINETNEGNTMRVRITAQKIHKTIQNRIGVLSSKYSPSQRIDRRTYDLCCGVHGKFGVMSVKYINEICKALDEAGIQYDDKMKDRKLIVISQFQTV